MPLSTGLYKSQDQQEQDLTDGPGWTIDDQKPSTFGGLASALPRGVGQGVSDGISLLTHGLHEDVIPAMIKANPFGAMLDGMDDSVVKGLPGVQTAEQANDALEAMSYRTREFSKSLVGDPRTTGTAANVVQGFSKAATEFTLGSLAGGPASGAAFMGATEGYAHYNDLLDLGVDEETAQKSGMTTAMLTGGSAVLPFAMPAKWLAGLSAPAALAAQAGTGAVVNTGFGAVNRYAEAKILRDAGYDAAADQQEVWDKTNLLTDAISGAFFGAHSGWHGIKELDGKRIDPSVLDAAKVVQDRQAVLDAAPGVPVDPKSAAVHKEMLSTSLEQLLTDKPVDLSEIDSAGAAFARGEVDESGASKIIRDAFMKSGVLDERDFNDNLDFLGGEKEEPTSQKAAGEPESVKPEAEAEPEGYDVGEQEEMSDELRRKFEGLRSRVPADETARTAGEGEPEESVSGGHAGDEAEGEPLTLHRGAQRELSEADFDDAALGHQTGRPSSGLGPFFTNDKAEAADYGNVTSHHLAMTNPLEMKAEDVPGFDSIKQAIKWREKQRSKGHDGLVIDASHMGGQTWYVPFSHDQVRPAGTPHVKTTGTPLTDRPDLQIADENGAPTSASDALSNATTEEAQANKEADPMHEAAAACEARHA